MVIVSGRVYVARARLGSFLASAMDSVRLARNAKGCLDYVLARDPLEPTRINVYERWLSEQALDDFRHTGRAATSSEDILASDVVRHYIASSGPA